MKPPTIEIHGTGTHNRGAELMAIAIAERLRSQTPNARVVVPPTPTFGRYEARSRYGFLTTWRESGLRTRALARIAPAWFRQIAGIISAQEVDAVFDASGFAFSDQWGVGQVNNLLRKMNAPHRRHQTLVLLPQAFGPFENPDVRRLTQQLFDRASLVCARDTVSHELAGPLCEQAKLRRYPDFTVGVAPQQPNGVAVPDSFTAIVPNVRMLDKTGSGERYLEFLGRAIRMLLERNLNPVFVLHDADEDRRVISAVHDQGYRLSVLEHSDPRVLKGILGRASFVIGSRFHALVSSLSQGVPCVGAGWSHKYPELFREFGCADLLVADLGSADALARVLGPLCDAETRTGYRQRITTAAQQVKQASLQMWEEVETIIRRVNTGAEPRSR